MLGHLAQRLDHVYPGRIAALWVFGECPCKYHVNFAWQVRLHTGGRGRRKLRVRHDQLRGRARKGHSPSDDLVGHHPERVEVTAPIDPASLGLLRRDILGRTHKYAGAGESLTVRIGRLSDAEVRQHHPTGYVHHHIVRLHIAVDSTLAMGEVQGAGHRLKEAYRIAEPEVGVFVEDTVQGMPVNVLHRNEIQTVLLTNVVDRHDTGVAQARRRARLTLESLDELGIHAQLRGQHLDGNRALEQRIHRTIDAGHTPAPNLSSDLVAAQPSPD